MTTKSPFPLARGASIALALCIPLALAACDAKKRSSSKGETDETEEEESSPKSSKKKDACLDKDDAKECEDRLVKLMKDGGKENTIEALKYAEKLCELKKKEGCMIAGGMYRGDKPGPTPDKKKAIKLFAAGCDLGHTGSCAAAAEQEFEAKEFGPAAKHADKACQAKDGVGCTVLALANIKGQGVPKDVRKGAELLQQGCDYGHKGACDMIEKLKK